MLHMFVSIIRTLFALLDTLVVWVIETLYVLLVKIAYTNVFGNFIYEMLGRVYVFLGVFMLFKISMSVISYIINPDSMTDKGKGFGKLITNVVISMILIVTVPSIFREAFRLQGLILNTNAIYQIVTGNKVSNEAFYNMDEEDGDGFIKVAEQSARQIAWGVYQPFIYTNYSTDELEDLYEVEYVNGEEKKVRKINWLLPTTELESGSATCQVTSTNGAKVITTNKHNGSIIKLKTGGHCVKDTRVCTTSSCLVNKDTVTADVVTDSNVFWFDDKEFLNEYKFLISTIAGCVVAYCFLTFCFDAAIRAIKLGILQVVAPIPILSMIDPKSGTEKLKKWASTCGKEYAGLFLRLASVFFATQVINVVLNPDDYYAMRYYSAKGTIGNVHADGWVTLFIIIGALMFAKQLPKFIEDILGVKLSGDGFNLKKRLGSAPGLKAAGAGALGFAGGMAANGMAARQNFGWDKDKGFMSNVGHNIKGAFSGAGSMAAGGVSAGYRGATSKEGNVFKAGRAGVQGATDARNLRDKRQKLGEGGPSGFMHRRIDDLHRFDGTKTRADILDDELKDLQYGPTGLEGYQESLFQARQRASEYSDFQYLRDDKGIALDSSWMNNQKKFIESYSAATGDTVDMKKELSNAIRNATGLSDAEADRYQERLSQKTSADDAVRAAERKVQDQEDLIRKQQKKIDDQKKIDAVNKKQK